MTKHGLVNFVIDGKEFDIQEDEIELKPIQPAYCRMLIKDDKLSELKDGKSLTIESENGGKRTLDNVVWYVAKDQSGASDGIKIVAATDGAAGSLEKLLEDFPEFRTEG